VDLGQRPVADGGDAEPVGYRVTLRYRVKLVSDDYVI
jgi:hypothetical protein